MNLAVMIILLAGLVLSALFTVLIRDLLKASIALAVMSAVLTVILFLLDAPLAAVFELSVCAGLVTVVFISAISMTKLRTKEEVIQHRQERRRRFVYLPVILIALLTVSLAVIWPRANDLLAAPAAASAANGADVFWKERQADLLGQIVIILAGVFGVLIFFKERKGKEE